MPTSRIGTQRSYGSILEETKCLPHHRYRHGVFGSRLGDGLLDPSDEHPDTDVRGNAVIGFAHLADRFGELSQTDVEPVLRAALADPKPHVREQAAAALGELSERLGWALPEPGESN